MQKSLFRRSLNRVLHLIAQFGPGAESFRPWIHKLRGVKIYGKVFIGDQVYIENEHPEAIELHDGVQITLRCSLVAHYRGVGKIIIGKDVWINDGAIVLCQVTEVPDGVFLGAGAILTKNPGPYEIWAGVPAQKIGEREPCTDTEIVDQINRRKFSIDTYLKTL